MAVKKTISYINPRDNSRHWWMPSPHWTDGYITEMMQCLKTLPNIHFEYFIIDQPLCQDSTPKRCCEIHGTKTQK